jgi:hypothetical protein
MYYSNMNYLFVHMEVALATHDTFDKRRTSLGSRSVCWGKLIVGPTARQHRLYDRSESLDLS